MKQTLPFRAVIIDGAPWFHLRDILKATDHRPFFIRRSMMPLAGVRKFLQDSDKPLAPSLLNQIDAEWSSSTDDTVRERNCTRHRNYDRSAARLGLNVNEKFFVRSVPSSLPPLARA